MKVTERLKILLILGLMLTGGIFFSLVTLNDNQMRINQELHQVIEIELKINELGTRLWLLFQYNDQDALIQTRYAHQDLKELLDREQFNNESKNSIIANLIRMNLNIGSLIELSQKDIESKFQPSITSPAGMLSARYNMTLQSMNEDLTKLQKLAMRDAELSQRKILYAVVIFLTLGSVFVLILIIMTLRTFKAHLNVLTLGIKDLEKGNLGSRLLVSDTDELSELAEQFNLMKHSLETTTIKKELLQEEVDRQTKELQKQRTDFQLLANYDSLTQLYSRSAFESQMKTAIARCGRTKLNGALLFIDLDRFKPINDNYGHSVGDIVLMHVSKMLTQAVRTSDIIARIGGDEFVIWLEPIDNARQVTTVIEKLLLSLLTPFKYGDISVSVSASIGVSFYPLDATDLSGLLRVADDNMYKAKATPDTYYYFTPEANRLFSITKLA